MTLWLTEDGEKKKGTGNVNFGFLLRAKTDDLTNIGYGLLCFCAMHWANNGVSPLENS